MLRKWRILQTKVKVFLHRHVYVFHICCTSYVKYLSDLIKVKSESQCRSIYYSLLCLDTTESKFREQGHGDPDMITIRLVSTKFFFFNRPVIHLIQVFVRRTDVVARKNPTNLSQYIAPESIIRCLGWW